MKYGLVGAFGRMGLEIRKVFSEHTLCLAVDVAKEEINDTPQVIVDFSSPAALPRTISICRGYKSALVIGTTAISKDDIERLRELGQDVAVVQSFNFSVGINVLSMVLKEFSPCLSDWDLEIAEIHHKHKKDAPSGTALLLRDAAGRDCPMHSLRLGAVPGDHYAFFSNEGEMLVLSHRAVSRSVFAIGALRAAMFALDAKPGFYSFEEVLRCTLKKS